jgi:hypothetical protein
MEVGQAKPAGNQRGVAETPEKRFAIQKEQEGLALFQGEKAKQPVAN